MKTFEENVRELNQRTMERWNKKLCKRLYGDDADEMEKRMATLGDIILKRLGNMDDAQQSTIK